MIERYTANNNRLLVESLREQQIVLGDSQVAEKLANAAKVQSFEVGERLITQNDDANEIYFILSGVVEININGRSIATRTDRQHVGEMALIDPGARRCADVIANRQTVSARVSEAHFSAIAAEHPDLWRQCAKELASRLRQRNALVQPPNPQPIVFIGSSAETLSIAEAIQAGLEHEDALVRIWSDGLFGASRFPIEDLENQVNQADIAVLVLGPDDKVESRSAEEDAPRDNCIFELGLFMGALTRERTFIVKPRHKELKIPTDLIGLRACGQN